MSDKNDNKPIPIDLVPYQEAIMGSKEFLRVWAHDDGRVACFVNPRALSPDPAVFGISMVDCIRYAAQGWANGLGISEEEAMTRILEGFDHERKNLTEVPERPWHALDDGKQDGKESS